MSVLPPPPAGPSAQGGNATMVLVLGIVGLVGGLGSCCCCLFFLPGVCSPVAWYLGREELAAIRAGLASPAGEGSARTGMILGIIGTAILALYIVFIIGYIAVVGFAGAMESLKSGGVPRIHH